MTRLAERKTRLSFVTEATMRYRGKMRNIVVEPDSYGETVTFRLQGCRVKYAMSWEGCAVQAAKLHEARERAEKARIRKEKRGSK